MNALPRLVDRFACDALAHELALELKPGLVSPTTRGSHADMDHRSFTASIAALCGYFGDCARLGAAGCDFRALQVRGLKAETQMFAATGGVNTHKGAIFTLGLLSAAAGRQVAVRGRLIAATLGEVVAHEWGASILASATDHDTTHGARLRQSFGLPGAREQAAAGFPVLFDVALPELRRALGRAASTEDASLHALLATMAVLPDTNLAHRGGIEGLRWAQNQALAFLAGGSMFAGDGRATLRTLCDAFVVRRLSPGGSADLLAAAWMLRHLDDADYGGLVELASVRIPADAAA